MSSLVASPAAASPRIDDAATTTTLSTGTTTPSTTYSTQALQQDPGAVFAGMPPAAHTQPPLDELELDPDNKPIPANEDANGLLPTDVSSDLSWLGPLIDDGKGTASSHPSAPSAPTMPAESPSESNNKPPEISTQPLRHTPNNNITDSLPRPQPAEQQQQQQQQQQPQPQQLLDDPLDLIANPSRKLSPGLAARLKALGLGTSRKLSRVTSGSDRVGRLPEDQIRQIDQYHQQRSADLSIERRGRPWKGIVRIPSRTSLKSAKSSKDAITPEDVDVPIIQILGSPGNDDTSELLHHEFEASEALDMDSNKYRLPDHTNGNGTKVTPDTRREHIERAARPPCPEDSPPPVPAKDTPPAASPSTFNPDDYFGSLGLQRPGSIYTISRASFANQLAQLTSLQLPDAESLAGKVAAIPTAHAAVKALIGAAEQIRSWIFKASEVISGLDSDDDVEWSAAGGREGLEEVESATTKFEGLINVYVTAIEQLQSRGDIANVSTDDLTKAVTQMEAITEEWTSIRSTLRSVRGQVEIAMEWEELWNVVLGEVESELDELRRLVFEMEERRHKSAMAIASGDGVDIGDLQTIVEETPPAVRRARAAKNRSSLTGLPASPGSPTPGGPTITADDSSLLALFARMQPLRASLDFLPMRLATFEATADTMFPTACDELDMRREALDASYRKLEKDAEGLRKELGEDRWVLVFRGAARQAQKMIESVDRSVARLKEAVDAGMHLTNQPAFLKKIESYDAKKTHYGPAIDRVLLIIDRGVKNRLTVNGEILRLHTEMQSKWADMKEQIKETDMIMDELHTDKRGAHLRDSVSSMLSNDMMSTVGSGVETPGSSPPSSVIMSGLGFGTRSPASKVTSGTRARRSSSSVSGGMPQTRRSVSGTTNNIPRKPVSRLSTVSGLSTPNRERASTSPASRYAGSIPRPQSTMTHRPKWNGSTNTNHLDTGHNFKPLTLSTPSPYSRKSTATPVRSHSSLAAPMGSRLPMRSPLRAPSPSPETPPRPVSKLNLLTGPQIKPRRPSLQPPRVGELGLSPRPASSMATSSRRTSMLPMPKFRRDISSDSTGRATPFYGARPRSSLKRGDSISENDAKDKPRWRH